MALTVAAACGQPLSDQADQPALASRPGDPDDPATQGCFKRHAPALRQDQWIDRNRDPEIIASHKCVALPSHQHREFGLADPNDVPRPEAGRHLDPQTPTVGKLMIQAAPFQRHQRRHTQGRLTAGRSSRRRLVQAGVTFRLEPLQQSIGGNHLAKPFRVATGAVRMGPLGGLTEGPAQFAGRHIAPQPQNLAGPVSIEID